MKLEKTLTQTNPGWMDQSCRSLLFKKLSQIKEGRIDLVECFNGADRSFTLGQSDAPESLTAKLRILKSSAYGRMVLGGSIGAGASYIDRDWECVELTNLIRIFARNRELHLNLDQGWGALLAPVQKLIHRFRKNSIEGSQKNIHAHYDLGNDFFELFLDSTWMYSSAMFKGSDISLEEAQHEKLDEICRRLQLKPTDHVIEIGTGWGGFALYAAQHYGCKITTTTISKEQYRLAVERIEKAGLSDRIEVLLQDYRLLQGTYDKLVSIEMIEAVGLDFLETYFEKCSSLLKPDGQMLLQAITIRDQYFEHARKNVDFIQRYIFPGAGIPSLERILKATTAKTDLQMAHQEDFGIDYAKTLRCWNERLAENKTKMLERGYPDSLYRMWQFYFSYCEGGFLERSIGVSQIHFLKPGYKGV